MYSTHMIQLQISENYDYNYDYLKKYNQLQQTAITVTTALLYTSKAPTVRTHFLGLGQYYGM